MHICLPADSHAYTVCDELTKWMQKKWERVYSERKCEAQWGEEHKLIDFMIIIIIAQDLLEWDLVLGN